MPTIKSTQTILAECAQYDLEHSTENVLTEGQIMHTLASLDEADEEIVFGPETVPVIKVGESYITDVRTMIPFMECAGIKSISEALDRIAECNDLPAKSVGIIECNGKECEEEIAIAKKKGGKVTSKTLDKLAKSVSLSDTLKRKGYPVKKKKGTGSSKSSKKK